MSSLIKKFRIKSFKEEKPIIELRNITIAYGNRQIVEKLNLSIIFGMVFILVGLAFKVSAVPFHMWTPDVYEGAPTSVTAFFAIVPKIAGVALIYRFCLEPFFNFYISSFHINNNIIRY